MRMILMLSLFGTNPFGELTKEGRPHEGQNHMSEQVSNSPVIHKVYRLCSSVHNSSISILTISLNVALWRTEKSWQDRSHRAFWPVQVLCMSTRAGQYGKKKKNGPFWALMVLSDFIWTIKDFFPLFFQKGLVYQTNLCKEITLLGVRQNLHMGMVCSIWFFLKPNHFHLFVVSPLRFISTKSSSVELVLKTKLRTKQEWSLNFHDFANFAKCPSIHFLPLSSVFGLRG